MAQYLRKRGNVYFVRVAVPRPLWPIIGRREIQRTTGTSDLKLADRRKHAIIADIRDEIDTLACTDPSADSWLERQGIALRRSVQRGELDSQLASDIMHDLRDRHSRAGGSLPVDRQAAATRLASDLNYLPLSDLVEKYLVERQPHVTASTLHKKRTELTAFSKWLGADSELTDINRKVTGSYLTEVLQSTGRSTKTQKIVVGILSAFTNWAIRRGHYEQSNPWSGLAEDFRGNRRGGNGNTRRPWTLAELAKIDTIDNGDPMYALCKIAQYSAMRLNEIAELKLTDVTDEMFVVTQAKNQNSFRQVPQHSAIKALVANLISTATDEYLIAGLKPGGQDHRRGHAISKRIGRWIRKVVTSDRSVVFHSLRNTAINRLEIAGVPEATVKLLVGHARQSMTYGTYSHGVGFELLREAIEKLDYQHHGTTAPRHWLPANRSKLRANQDIVGARRTKGDAP